MRVLIYLMGSLVVDVTRNSRLEIGVKLEETQFVLKHLLRLGGVGLVAEALKSYQLDTNVFCDH
jgi:hypothetical protein